MICCETTCPWSAMEQPVHGLLGNNLPMICWGTICPWSTREQFVYDLLGKNLSIIYWGTICPRSTREQPAHDLLGNNLSIIYWGTICPWYAEAQPVHDLLANNLSMMCRGEKKKRSLIFSHTACPLPRSVGLHDPCCERGSAFGQLLSTNAYFDAPENGLTLLSLMMSSL